MTHMKEERYGGHLTRSGGHGLIRRSGEAPIGKDVYAQEALGY